MKIFSQNMYFRIKRKQKSNPQSRKEVRKERRQQKKKNRYNYHNVKKVNRKIAKNVEESTQDMNSCCDDEEILSEIGSITSEEHEEQDNMYIDKLQTFLNREKKEHDEYFREIKMNRVEQLKKANEEEDNVIAKYEKLLKLNRGKKSGGESSTIGKFNDGLDYLLELCTDDSIQKMYKAAKEANKGSIEVVKKSTKRKMGNESDSENSDEIEKLKSYKLKKVEEKYFGNDDEAFFKAQSNLINNDSCDGDDSELESRSTDEYMLEKCETEVKKLEEKLEEDIYGRKRDKQGNVVQEMKYVPPHLRKFVSRKNIKLFEVPILLLFFLAKR